METGCFHYCCKYQLDTLTHTHTCSHKGRNTHTLTITPTHTHTKTHIHTHTLTQRLAVFLRTVDVWGCCWDICLQSQACCFSVLSQSCISVSALCVISALGIRIQTILESHILSLQINRISVNLICLAFCFLINLFSLFDPLPSCPPLKHNPLQFHKGSGKCLFRVHHQSLTLHISYLHRRSTGFLLHLSKYSNEWIGFWPQFTGEWIQSEMTNVWTVLV